MSYVAFPYLESILSRSGDRVSTTRRWRKSIGVLVGRGALSPVYLELELGWWKEI
jgi:hypothetical protein